MITANLKDGFTKSLGDAANTQIIDTTKFAFGRYYKFDIPTTVKDTVPGGVDIENTAGQVVHSTTQQLRRLKHLRYQLKNVLTVFQLKSDSTSLNVWKVVSLKLTNSHSS